MKSKEGDVVFFKNKAVLVTGATGFIGSHLVDRALKEGAEKVVGLDNFAGSSAKNIAHLKTEPRFEFVRGDIRDSALVKKLVLQSDYVLNEAASKLVVSDKNPRLDAETNVVGTLNMLEAVRASDAVMVHASTGSIYGSSAKPMPENHPKNPTTPYGISKLAGDHYCLFFAREFGLPVTVLRYFHVYGPRQDYSGEAGVVSIFISKVLQNKPPIIFGIGEQIRCFTYIEDDVDANMLLLKNKTAGEAFNVASKERISVRELADMVIKKYGKRGMKAEFGPARAGENLKPIPDTSKIEKLGFKAKVSFEVGLEKTKKWIEADMRSKER